MSKLLNSILDEQRFPYEGINLEERNYYLNIIKNCKDIIDSEHKVDGESKSQINELHFKKVNNQVIINGSLIIGSRTKENRCINGYIFIENNSILVDMHIIRLSNNGAFMEYTVLDEFKIVDGFLRRNSFYNYDMREIEIEINDEIMKGKLK